MDRIKTAIIGCGRDANNMHGPTLLSHPDFEVVGTYDTCHDAAEKMAAHFRGQGHKCRSYETREELLKSEVQLCVVLTDSYTHLEVCTACLRAGKFTLVTKPWVLNVDEADKLIRESDEARKKSGAQLMVFLPMSWDNVLGQIREIVSSGQIGQVYQIRRRISTFGKRYDWQLYKKYGGGYLNNWGPHLVGQAMELVNEPVVKVCAEKKQVIMDGDCEDTFYAMLKTKSGVIINCEYAIMIDKLPHWTIQGSKGTMFVTDNRIELHRVSHPGPIDPTAYRNPFKDDCETIEVPVPADGGYSTIYAHVASVIRGEAVYRVPLSFTRNLTLLMDAIHSSADTDELVRISAREWEKG